MAPVWRSLSFWICPWLTLKLSLAQCKLQAPIVTPWLHRFILTRETWLYSSAKLSDHKVTRQLGLPALGPSVFERVWLALLIAGRLQIFFRFFFHIILTEPLETQACVLFVVGFQQKEIALCFFCLLWSWSTHFLCLPTVSTAQFYARAKQRGPSIYLPNHFDICKLILFVGGQIPFMDLAVYTFRYSRWWYAPTAATSTAVDSMETFQTPWDHFLILWDAFYVILNYLDLPINFNKCRMKRFISLCIKLLVRYRPFTDKRSIYCTTQICLFVTTERLQSAV